MVTQLTSLADKWDTFSPLQKGVAVFVVVLVGVALVALIARYFANLSARQHDRKPKGTTRKEPDILNETVPLAVVAAPNLRPQCHICGTDGDPGSIFCVVCGSRYNVTEIRQQLRFDGRALDMTIGRDETSNIILRHERCSRLHAKVIFDRGHILLIDKSANGTFINNNRIKSATLVCPGDTIMFANEQITFDALTARIAAEIHRKTTLKP